MKTKLLLFILAIFLLNTGAVYADYFTPQASGAINQLIVNKTVKNPQTSQFVDNLNVTDPHFLNGQTVNFRIAVNNTGNTTLSNVAVKDQLPNSLDFISGPGNFENNSHTLNFTIDNLNSGETKTYDLSAKVNSSNLPAGNQVTCVTNLAQAQVNQLLNQDTAGLCIETQVMAPVQELPKTGPGSTVAIIAGSLISLTLAISFYLLSLKKKALA